MFQIYITLKKKFPTMIVLFCEFAKTGSVFHRNKILPYNVHKITQVIAIVSENFTHS